MSIQTYTTNHDALMTAELAGIRAQQVKMADAALAAHWAICTSETEIAFSSGQEYQRSHRAVLAAFSAAFPDLAPADVYEIWVDCNESASYCANHVRELRLGWINNMVDAIVEEGVTADQITVGSYQTGYNGCELVQELIESGYLPAHQVKAEVEARAAQLAREAEAATPAPVERTPLEVDTDTAKVLNDLQRASSHLEYINHATSAAFGCYILRDGKTVGRGHRGAVRMTTDAQEWAAVQRAMDNGVTYVQSLGNLARHMEDRDKAAATVRALDARLEELAREYRGWSRFYVVTTSAGHIHSSMACHTCRPTTGFGWLPALSGKSEADAVAELGPALCSVCFPSAPVEHQNGRVRKSTAQTLAADALR